MLSEIISKLQKIQLDRRWTDKEMAKQLGCSRQLWQMTRSGKIPLGSKILKGISTTFPGLKQDVIYFLSNDANKIPPNANREPQGRGIKRFFVELLGRIKR